MSASPANDPVSPQEKRRRVQELVKQLKGRVIRASELTPNKQENPAPSASIPELSPSAPHSPGNAPSLPHPPRSLGPRHLADLYPDAIPIGAQPGQAWLLRTEVPLDGAPAPNGIHLPGSPEFPQALDLSLAAILNIGADFSSLRRNQIAFFDVETTGLMGGTGTYPFLIGIGFFESLHFVVEQYFMEDFPYEPEMLESLHRRLGQFAGLVSFNGKTFDAPLLRTRFLMNRMPSPLEMPHLDLLHAARRLWKGRLESCSFASIEREIFNMRRFSDVPGSLIPAIYIDYVKGARRSQMVPVIDHNAQDIVSMASLFGLFCLLYQNPENPVCQHSTDQVGLARWYQRASRHEEALRCMERAMLLARQPDEEHALAMHLANLCRRMGRWEQAAEIWAERVRVARAAARLAPCICLAKYCEHRLHDLPAAIRWAEMASSSAEASMDTDAVAECAKRLQRLNGKLPANGYPKEDSDCAQH